MSTVKVSPRGKTREVNVVTKENTIDVAVLQEFFGEMAENATKSNSGNLAAGRRLRVNISEFKVIAKQLRSVSSKK